MNSDQDIKMFSKQVLVVANASAVVDLKDTAGNLLACDYIEIETNLLTGGTYQAIPSGVDNFAVSAPGSDNYAVGLPTSSTNAGSNGAPGWIGSISKTLKISLPYTNRASRLTIQCVAATTIFYVRYGISKKKNQQRDPSPRSAADRGS